MRSVFRALLPALIVLSASALCERAEARAEAKSGYTKAQTFSCALRLLRVDRGYEIVEKDLDAAYVLFRYPLSGQKRTASGSLEVVETDSNVRVFVQLPSMPEYHETLLRDALLKKLREEYGPPKAPAPKTPPPVKPAPPDDAPAPAKPEPPKHDEDS